MYSSVKSLFESLLVRVLNLIGAGSVNSMNHQTDNVPFWAERDQIA